MADAERDAAVADRIIHRTVEELAASAVPVSVSIDRLLTYAAALSVSGSGAAHTAEEFRRAADRIAAGEMSKFEPVSH